MFTLRPGDDSFSPERRGDTSTLVSMVMLVCKGLNNLYCE